MARAKSVSVRARSFKAWMKANETNTKRVAEKADFSYTTLASFIQGDTQSLKGDNEQKIAKAMQASVAEIFGGLPPSVKTVPLVGYVGAGAEAHFYASGDEGLGDVDAPDGSTEQTRAAEVRGESLGPLFEHWLIFYDDVRTPVTADLIGKLCIVGLPNDKVLVKKLRRSRTEGLFHLLSNSEEPMLDQEVLWAARVKQMMPK